MADNKNLTIIDADSIIWIVGYKYREKGSPVVMKSNVDKFIRSILSNTKATAYIGYIGSNKADKLVNFRKTIYPEYKANRKVPPDWFKKVSPIIIDHMVSKWKFSLVEGMEADDAVAISAEKYRDIMNVTIATGDKDLKNIPEVYYYEFRKTKPIYITTEEAEHHLAMQVLHGDTTDNIPGLFNIGKVKAKNILGDAKSTYALFRAVAYAYINHSNTLYNKYIRSKKGTIEETVLKSSWYNESRTKAQIERKIRLLLDEEAKKFVNSKIVGGWKEWLRLQYNLVNLLSKETDNFKVTDPIIYSPIIMESSDFLYSNIT